MVKVFFLLYVSLVSLMLVLSPSPAFASDLNSDVEQQVLQVIRKHPEVILESIQDFQQQQQEKEKQEKLSLLQCDR
ncbi:hypothetical protein FM036_25085 [Nostoc sp. HG1]|nr:hypothetical protein [Nostoc sp. HG1]MCL6754986.1 hypothetical protein [Nostoc sp. CCCryo 231-06]